jgi:hypothetical protein
MNIEEVTLYHLENPARREVRGTYETFDAALGDARKYGFEYVVRFTTLFDDDGEPLLIRYAYRAVHGSENPTRRDLSQ